MKLTVGIKNWGSVALFGLMVACGSEEPVGVGGAAGDGAGGSPVAVLPVPPTAGTSTTSVAPNGTGGTPGGGLVAVAGSSAPVGTVPANTTPPSTTVPAGAGDASQWCGVKQTLDTKCTACHDEKKTAGAPMPLQKYEDLMAPAVSDPAKKVYQVVGTRVHDAVTPMPPQGKLTDPQLTEIDAWVAAGGPPGSDPTCAGSAPAQPTAAAATWPTNCDQTYKITAHGTGGANTPYSVPAGQETHPKINIPAPWGNTTMQAIAFRSITDNPKVLHHWILYGPSREHLVGWAPGKQEISAMGDSDVGMNMAGGDLTLDMHYNNLLGTTAESDSSGVEVCLLEPEHFRKNTAAVYGGFTQFSINIPPHSSNFDVTASCTIQGSAPVTVIAVSPHAHTLARHMKFTLKRASGETIIMHDGAFAFEEQQNYPLDAPLVLNSGDVVTTTCTFDNDSDRSVTFGENTGNEMCFNFATYYPIGQLNCGGRAGVGGFAPGGFSF